MSKTEPILERNWKRAAERALLKSVKHWPEDKLLSNNQRAFFLAGFTSGVVYEQRRKKKKKKQP